MKASERNPQLVESGRRIRRYREDADMSQADLAEALNEKGQQIRANTVSTWERGLHKPHAGVYRALSQIFGAEYGRPISIAELRASDLEEGANGSRGPDSGGIHPTAAER
jgi:transcriptional regulator with XRE-family HTH domain